MGATASIKPSIDTSRVGRPQWKVVALTAALITTGCSAGAGYGGADTASATSPHVVAEALTLTLTLKTVKLKVGDELWITGSKVCAGLPSCETLFVPFTTSDPRVVAVVDRDRTYDGLPAERFVAVSAGRGSLSPVSPCPPAICSKVAEFIPTVIVEVA